MLYTTVAAVRAYILEHGTIFPELELPVPPAVDEVIALIDRCERDVDRVIGGPIPEGAALRLDPLLLSDAARDALSRAVCAQCEYRLGSGEIAYSQSEDLSSPDVTVLSRWTRIGPKVAEELAGHGLIRRTLTAAPTPTPDAP